MIVLGLAGQAGVGKDTVAEYLRDNYGFIMFAFSDNLYREVQEAFGLPDQDLLRNRDTKELPSDRLTLQQCSNSEFVTVARKMLVEFNPDSFNNLDAIPMSPRQVMQWWGSEYRRALDSDYWVKQSHEFVRAMQNAAPYPEQRPQYFVNTTVRFKNERDWIHAAGGNVWHIRREGVASVNAHVSETSLEVLEGERELFNNDTIERLYGGIDLMLRTGAQFVRVEPMAPMQPFLDACAEVGQIIADTTPEPEYAGPWCCEQGEQLNVAVCDECATASAGYSQAMGVSEVESNCPVSERIQ